MKITILILLMNVLVVLRSGAAPELEVIQDRLSKIERPSRLLEVLVRTGVIHEATWEKANPLIGRVTGDMGERSVSILTPKSATVQSVVLVGSSPKFGEDPNIVVNAVLIKTEGKMLVFKFAEGKGYVVQPKSSPEGKK